MTILIKRLGHPRSSDSASLIRGKPFDICGVGWDKVKENHSTHPPKKIKIPLTWKMFLSVQTITIYGNTPGIT